MEPTTFYLPSGMATPHATWGVIVLFGILLFVVPLVKVLVDRARQLLHARQAAQAMSGAHAPTHLGPLVLAGKVDDDGDGPAVSIAITQRGREWQYKGSWNSQWREVDRAVTVRPFHVVRPSGERVRVEPDEGVFLVDRLDGLEVRGPGERVRLARLTPGELVFVVGTATQGFDPAHGGYRDGALGFVVRPARGQRMLLSTEPLTERHRKTAREDGKLALLLLLGLVVTHLGVFLRPWTLRLTGHVDSARVLDADSYQALVRSRSGDHWVTHYRLRLLPSDAVDSFTMETSHDCFWRAHDHELEGVPLLRSGSLRQLGTEAAADQSLLVIYALMAVLYVIAVFVWRARKRPWYERRRLIERFSGRLDPTRLSCK